MWCSEHELSAHKNLKTSIIPNKASCVCPGSGAQRPPLASILSLHPNKRARGRPQPTKPEEPMELKGRRENGLLQLRGFLQGSGPVTGILKSPERHFWKLNALASLGSSQGQARAPQISGHRSLGGGNQAQTPRKASALGRVTGALGSSGHSLAMATGAQWLPVQLVVAMSTTQVFMPCSLSPVPQLRRPRPGRLRSPGADPDLMRGCRSDPPTP
jgi:hypothetical protein